MTNYLLVAAGGVIGVTLRYWLGGLVSNATAGKFPYGTLMVNIVGCFLIGFFLTLGYERFAWRPELRLFIAVGMLGGFTTFSTFSFETISLLREGLFLQGFINTAASIIGCLTATFLAVAVARKI